MSIRIAPSEYHDSRSLSFPIINGTPCIVNRAAVTDKNVPFKCFEKPVEIFAPGGRLA